MRYPVKYISILLTLLAATLGGCVYDDSPAGCSDGGRLQGDVPVRFTLMLDDFGEESRAAQSGVWNDLHNKEIGSRFDSQINRLHVMLIDGSGNLAHATLRNYMYNADDKGYTFAGNINFPEEGWEAGNYRVMVLANCGPAQLGAKTLTELKAEIDNVMWNNPDGSPRSGILIPMWGATTHTFTFTGNNDAPEDIGSIDLLRAVSKVQIMLDPSKMGGYELVSVKISTANAYINPFPTGWEAATATIDNSLRFGSAFNPVSSAVTGGTFVPDAFPDEARGSIVFYLPEYDSATTEATIDVTLRHEATGQTFTYPAAIHFNDGNINKTGSDFPSDPDYPGKRLPTDIVRNHYYQFTIDGIDFGTLTYSVNCWNYIPSTLGWAVGDNNGDTPLLFTNADSRYCQITHPRNTTKKIKEIENGKLVDKNIKLLENSSSQLNFTFTITQPEGAVWKAFLYDDAACTQEHDYKTFRFAPGNNNNANIKAVRTGIARKDPYNIAIDVDKNCWIIGNPVEFSYPNSLNDDGSIKEYKKIDKIFAIESVTGSGFYDTRIPLESPDYALNDKGKGYREEGKIPTVYLVIKVSLDGEHFTENLSINPPYQGDSKENYFNGLTYPGTKTKIEIRQVYYGDYDASPQNLMEGQRGDNKFGWWNPPMGYTAP